MLQIRHVLSTSAATLLNAVFGFALTFLVARLLSPTDNGYYAQYLFVMNAVYISFNFGIGTSNTYFIASKKWSIKKAKKINTNFLMLLALLLLCIILIFKKYLIIEDIENILNIPEKIFYIGIISGIALTGIYQTSSILMGLHKYDKNNLLGIVKTILPVLFISCSLLVIDSNLILITTIQSLTLFISFLYGLTLLSKYENESKSEELISSKSSKFFSYTCTSYASNLLHFLAMRGILIAISYYSLPEEVGYFNLALLLLEGMLLLPSVIGQLLLPQSSTSSFSPILTEKLLRINIYISIFAVLITIIFSKFIVDLVLGENYSKVSVLLLHLSPSILLMVIPRFMSQILSGLGQPVYALTAAIISLLLGTSLALWLIPTNGIEGAAWITNITALITAIITMYGYMKIKDRKFLQIIKPQKNDFIIVKSFFSTKKK